jgi:hypothetical protein
MASLLNNASLLLNPAGSIIAYEEDKILSVLPSNGTGDFTFTGGDGGTRVNQQGYIEVTPANTNTYSEKFGTGYWNNFGGTITDDSVIAPNGTVTGTTFNGSPAGVYKTFPGIVPGQVYTVSMYVKLGTATNCVIIINNTQAWNTVGGKSFTSADGLNTTDWTRISFTFTGPAFGAINWHIGYQFESGVTQQTNGTYFVWGAMLNIGSTAKPYQPTTDRLNYPRITYQNGRGALLSEPQRTNVTTNSQTISAGTGTTVSLDSGISPDGTQNADKLIEDTSTGTHITTFGGSLGGSVDSSTFCVSIFAKAAERTRFIIFDNNQGAGAAINVFDLGNGTKISGNGTIENYGNGWYRCIIFPSKTDNTTANIQIRLINTGTNDSYTGDGSSGIFFWGKQIETGEFASTYIPTTSATVTRPIDQFFKNDSPALSTTNWTFYMSGVNIGKNQNSSGNPIDAPNWSFDSGAGPYGPNSLHNYNNTVYYYDTVNGAANLGDIGSTTTKFAVTKNGTTFKLFRNGVLFSTNVLSLASNVWDSFRMYGAIDAEGQAFSNNPSTIGILPSALSDANAQALTTIRSGSGGNISYYGPYTIHTFTGSATFTPSFTGPVEVLVVAGGGGGGFDFGGGGGAGGLLYTSAYGVSSGTGITVTIGAGGAGAPPAGQSTSGGNSAFGGLTAIGGGGGANGSGANVYGPVKNGGSGGGAGGWVNALRTVSGSGIPGQGFDGGIGDPSTDSGGAGGGGGAGQKGQNASGATAGDGGDGLPYSITGFSTYYAGGGGGGTYPNPPGGTGGLGGGGDGTGGNSVNGFAATANTGGGGGGNSGGGAGSGGNGGSGIVIVRYLT